MSSWKKIGGKKLFMVFFFFLQNETEKSAVCLYSAPVSQHILELPINAITAAILLWYVYTSFAHL